MTRGEQTTSGIPRPASRAVEVLDCDRDPHRPASTVGSLSPIWLAAPVPGYMVEVVSRTGTLRREVLEPQAHWSSDQGFAIAPTRQATGAPNPCAYQ
jgi:hypothetical protein